jgi:hypothetical protein
MELIRRKSQLKVGSFIFNPSFPLSTPDVIDRLDGKNISFGSGGMGWTWPISHFMKVARKGKWQIKDYNACQ